MFGDIEVNVIRLEEVIMKIDIEVENKEFSEEEVCMCNVFNV